MSVMGNLELRFKERFAGLDKALRNAKRDVRGSMLSMSRTAGFMATAAGAAIIGLATVSVKAFATAGDEVAKMAKRTGFGVAALSELGFAAERSGSSLNALETGVKRMQRAITEFSREVAEGNELTGEYGESFADLGVKFEQLKGKTPEEQFLVLAKAINNVDDATRRAAFAQEIFGKAGTQLLPLILEGAEGIEKLRQRARDLGIVFTDKTAKAAEDLIDNLLDLTETVKAVGFQIAIALVPRLNEVIPRITDIVMGVVNWAKANPEITKGITLAVSALGLFLVAVGPLLIVLPGLAVVASTVASVFATGVAPVLGVAAAAVAGLTAAFFVLKPVMEKAVGFIRTNWAQIVKIFKTMGNTVVNIVKIFVKLIELSLTFAVKILEGVAKGFADAWLKIADANEDGTLTTLEKIEFFTEEINKFFAAIERELDEFLASWRKTWNEFPFVVEAVSFAISIALRSITGMIEVQLRQIETLLTILAKLRDVVGSVLGLTGSARSSLPLTGAGIDPSFRVRAAGISQALSVPRGGTLAAGAAGVGTVNINMPVDKIVVEKPVDAAAFARDFHRKLVREFGNRGLKLRHA